MAVKAVGHARALPLSQTRGCSAGTTATTLGKPSKPLESFPDAESCSTCTLACGMYTWRAVQLYSYGCSSPLPHSNSGTKE